MISLSVVLSICLALLLGAMSPGPTFIAVVQNAVIKSRKHGLATAFGTAVGAMLFGLFAVIGLQAVLLAVPSIYILLKVFGGLYLIWLAIKVFKGANKAVSFADNDPKTGSMFTCFQQGIFTQLSNPKTAVIMASIFTALLPKTLTTLYIIVIPALCFMIDFTWYALVSVLFSSKKPREIYLRFKTVFDYLSSGILCFLGIKLLIKN